ncbi:hypothetical protein EZJ58_4224 [Sodalis ligni]|uniref:Uncharacterized protein n=1 Tax=Sodalis ligni TaxID=2697027 RepID=A0A4R1NNT0_9GAMM|nr:hypothetical protein EZJ58_4224 [Sodalis ligni]
MMSGRDSVIDRKHAVNPSLGARSARLRLPSLVAALRANA